MALPTIVFDEIVAGTNSSLISEFMPKLTALLKDAGWTLLYADSDAIGGGSAGTPAWDKSPSMNTSAGVMILKMPLNDHDTDFHLQLEAGWGANVGSNHYFSVTVGTGWDTVDTLTGAGNTFTWQSNAASTGLQVLMNASEDGFSFYCASSNSGAVRWVLVERARELENDDPGGVSSDLLISGYATQGSFPNNSPASGCVRVRDDGHEHATNYWAALAMAQHMTGWQTPNTGTFTSDDGQYGAPIGPFNVSGRLSALPRLLLLLQQPDAITNTDHPVLIDGGVKQYRTPASFVTNAYVSILATE